MYGVSDAFKTAVRGSHTAGVRCEVWSQSDFLQTLYPLDGSVDVDSRRAIRRTLTLTLAADDATLVPDYSGSILAPYGNEIKVWRSVNGEEVPLGVFLITSVEVSTSAGGTTLTVNASDRALRIQRARWTEPFAIRSQSTENAISKILKDRWAAVTYNSATTGYTVTKSTFGLDLGGDPWADALKIADAAGYDLFFDVSGAATLASVRSYASTAPVATYIEDDEAMIVDLRRSLSSDETYNGVIVTGEGSGVTPVRAEAWDEEPDSPTYRYGAFGEVPTFYSSPMIESATQAQAAADRRLSKVTGLVEGLQWTQVCDPSLDVTDLVAVYNAATKVERVLLLDRLTIPLRPDAPMGAIARTIRTGLA